jgi:hypothetical protein
MKAKNLLLSISACACMKHSSAQAPDWTWAESAGGGGYDYGISVAADDSGNSYVAGYFGSHLIIFGADTLTKVGDYDLFTVKYDSSGNVLWARSAGGSDIDWANSVAADASGNSYLAGRFGSSAITFGSITLINANAGYSDMFLVQYDASGNASWAKRAGGNNTDRANSVAADTLGNSYVAGYFDSPTITFGTTTLSTVSGADVFLAKYDASGNATWAKSAGGSDDDYANSAATDASGNTYVAGYFFSPSISFGTITLTKTGYSDMFLAKYDASGNAAWAKSAGGNDYDRAYSVATDASGNSYVSGVFLSDSITFGATTLTNAGGYDMFLAKYDASGNLIWANRVGGSDNDGAQGVAVDVSGNAYVTGYFESPTISVGATTLTNAGSGDVFLVKYDRSGNVLWAASAGGSDDDMGYGVATDASGNCYLAGAFFEPTITFGATTLASVNGYDMFIAKTHSCAGIADTSVAVSGATLTANASAATYQWLDCGNGFAVIGTATSQAFTATANGSYAVAVTEHSCTDTSSCHTVNVVDIHEQSLTKTFWCIPTQRAATSASDSVAFGRKSKLRSAMLRAAWLRRRHSATSIRLTLR